LLAQAPSAFNYQAVLRNSEGQVISNQATSIRISILSGIADGDIVYQETHSPTTNDFGLVVLEIGKGTVVSGVFEDIALGTTEHFLKVEMDATGGSSYAELGVSQLLSVPYAITSNFAVVANYLNSETGLITEAQIIDLTHFTNDDEIDPIFDSSVASGITETDTTNWNNKSEFSGSYDDLTDKPTVISDFVMDANSQSIINLATPENAQDAATKAYVDLLEARIAALELTQMQPLDYNGNSYKVAKIGDQVWMAENLKATHYADGTALVDATGVFEPWENTTTKYYYWYNDDIANKNIYGALYNWAAIMNGAGSSDASPSGVQGICPNGWHLPSDAEWKTLELELGMSESDVNSEQHRFGAGDKLRETGTTHWDSPNTAATNESGFTALPGGLINSWRGSEALGVNAYFWTTTEVSDYSSHVYFRDIHGDNDVYRHHRGKVDGMSVRCVKN
jgi:uncharacterized protein (TIGR02145 family)